MHHDAGHAGLRRAASSSSSQSAASPASIGGGSFGGNCQRRFELGQALRAGPARHKRATAPRPAAGRAGLRSTPARPTIRHRGVGRRRARPFRLQQNGEAAIARRQPAEIVAIAVEQEVEAGAGAELEQAQRQAETRRRRRAGPPSAPPNGRPRWSAARRRARAPDPRIVEQRRQRRPEHLGAQAGRRADRARRARAHRRFADDACRPPHRRSASASPRRADRPASRACAPDRAARSSARAKRFAQHGGERRTEPRAPAGLGPECGANLRLAAPFRRAASRRAWPRRRRSARKSPSVPRR